MSLLINTMIFVHSTLATCVLVFSDCLSFIVVSCISHFENDRSLGVVLEKRVVSGVKQKALAAIGGTLVCSSLVHSLSWLG